MNFIFNLVMRAHAATVAVTPLPGTTPPASIPGWIENFYTLALAFAGILAFGAIVYGGVRYAIGHGNPSSESEGKSWIQNALLGLLLLAAAWIILATVNPQIVTLSIPGLPKLQVTTATTGGGGTGVGFLAAPGTPGGVETGVSNPTLINGGSNTNPNSFVEKVYACNTGGSGGSYDCSPQNKPNCSDVDNGCGAGTCMQINVGVCSSKLITYGCDTGNGNYACSPEGYNDYYQCSNAPACANRTCQILLTSQCLKSTQ